MPSNYLILSPLLLPPSIFPSISLFQWVSSLHQVAKVLEFQHQLKVLEFQHQLQHQSFQFPLGWTGWFSLQSKGLSRVFCNTSSKALILQHSAFFIDQLSHPYMTTGKTIDLTRCTFVGKVMSLLFNMLSRLVITSLPRSKCLLISWLQSPSALILEPPEIKACQFPLFPHLFAMKWWAGCHDLSFLNVEF